MKDSFVYTIEDSNIPKMFAGVSRLLSQSSSFRRLLANVGSGRIQEIISMITQNQSGIPLSNIDFSLQFSEQDPYLLKRDFCCQFMRKVSIPFFLFMPYYRTILLLLIIIINYYY